MRALIAAALAAVLLSLAPEARSFSDIQHPNRLTVLVTVLANPGAPVAGLTAADFVVREGSATREVIDASLSDEPLSVAMLVDTVKPPMGSQAPVRDIRTSFAAFVVAIRAHAPGTALSLTEFGGAPVTVADFDVPAEKLDFAVARIYPNLPSDAKLLEALDDASTRLRARPMPRRAIVSVDLHSVEGGDEAMMTRAAKAVSASGATYWAISVRGPGQSARRRDSVLDAVTKSSGGLRVFAAEAAGLETLLTQVAASLASQYVVTFARPSSQPVAPVTMDCRCGNRVRLSPMIR
ncbi:MAG: hypothetical protein WD690_06710 [Vicinamibacterales bacterium]